MSRINQLLEKIKKAVYGEEVRGAIVEAIQQCYSDSVRKDVIIDESLSANSENPVQNKIITSALNTKVDKSEGKNLSSNDYTTAEKNKLSGIEAGANKTVVDSALSGTSTNPVQNKAVKTALDKKADKELVEEMFQDFTAPTAEGGFAAGHEALADSGGAIGYGAKTVNGFAGGKGAVANGFRNNGNTQILSETGGAVGEGAKAGRGFAGGFNATVAEQEGSNGTIYIDAVQLGTGHNDKPGTAKIYDYELFDEAGRIPSGRLRNTNGGFNAGMYSSATFGGAVGSGAVAGKGFAGGFEAKTVNDGGQPIDAVQLGRGTNTVPGTAQIYDYPILNAEGKIPSDRLPDSVKGNITVDSELSATSENPVQNKAICSELSSYPKLDANGKVPTAKLPLSFLSYNADSEEIEAVPDTDTDILEVPTYELMQAFVQKQAYAAASAYSVPKRLYNQGTDKILICDDTPDILKNAYPRYADVELVDIDGKKFITKIGNWYVGGSSGQTLNVGEYSGNITKLNSEAMTAGAIYDGVANLVNYTVLLVEIDNKVIIAVPNNSTRKYKGSKYNVDIISAKNSAGETTEEEHTGYYYFSFEIEQIDGESTCMILINKCFYKQKTPDEVILNLPITGIYGVNKTDTAT